jgi:type I restriction enzyme, S subunit
VKWPMVKLGDLVSVNPRLPKDADESQEVTFVAMASASEEGFLIDSEKRILSETRKGFTYFERSDVLLAKITPCFENGKCLRANQISTDIGFGSTEFHVLRVNPEKINTDYLFYLIWNDAFRFYGEKSMSGAAGQKRVGTDFLKNFEIPLPPLAEQQRIAAILDKADAIRRKRQQAIQLADDFLRAVFLDMFGDPVTNPKGWEVRPLRNQITFITSGGRGWSKYYSDSGARFIRSLDVQMNYIGSKDIAYVTPPDNAEAKRTKVKSGDVLLTITGSRIGRVCVVPESFDAAFISQHVSLIRVDETVNPRYLSMFLSLESGGQSQISKAQYGQSKPGLNFDHIGSFKILMPPRQKQDQFVELWDKSIGVSERMSESECAHIDLFNSLSQKAFAGEL